LLAMGVALLEGQHVNLKRKPEEMLAACGIKAEEIAGILGKNVNAVYVALHRAGRAKTKKRAPRS
jgi:hypothetical protein